ncbi:MAG: ATP-binding cassette domain-containing protein, partial [Treponemataceae bacterium]
MQEILRMQNIRKSFPGVIALKNIDLKLHKGEILAILGENGAGKSTLMKVLTGVYQAEQGEIFAFGEQVHIKNYKESKQLGISIIFQELSLIPYLNVWENIFLGNEKFIKGTTFLNKKAMRNASKELLETLGVALDIESPIDQLSIADQQFVEIAKALSVQVRILILDEPTSTLTPREVEKLFAVMKTLQKKGVGMIFISHHLEELFEISENVLVLRDGETVAQTPTKDLTKDMLIKQVIGRSLGLSFPPKRNLPNTVPIVLEVKNLQLAAENN